MKDLFLYNTLTRQKEKFTPLSDKEVTLYSCGPTVYHYVHIGNLRTYTLADILKRVFLYHSQTVNHFMNITDVGHLVSDGDEGEDKMQKGARREGKTAWEVAKYYTDAALSDMQKLNFIPPAKYTKATDHIPEQIKLIQQLEKKGFTYIIDDGVYFDTSQFPAYGQMAKLDIEGLKEGARVDKNNQKKNITDFALWKFSPKDEQRDMEWVSPWGIGFPGWHIECSAMALKHLGQTIDIHIGGTDLIPVHHTNEIAQSEAATDKPFVNYWIHGAFLNLVENGEEIKMSKSSGNLITLQSIENQSIEPLAFRYLLLTAHYRTQLEFSTESLQAAENAFRKLKNTYLDFGEESIEPSTEIKEKFSHFINDDLNTPQALAYLWDLMKENLSDAQKKGIFLEFDKVFGLGFAEMKKQEAPQEILELAKKRQEARENKDWAISDQIRDQIKEKGWQVEDTDEGFEMNKL